LFKSSIFLVIILAYTLHYRHLPADADSYPGRYFLLKHFFRPLERIIPYFRYLTRHTYIPFLLLPFSRLENHLYENNNVLLLVAVQINPVNAKISRGPPQLKKNISNI